MVSEGEKSAYLFNIISASLLSNICDMVRLKQLREMLVELVCEYLIFSGT
jgi:hypothetical protein